MLAGADFGAGIWQLLSGPGERGERIREHAHESMGPVWEANHVWLIFVLTVTWTAYPVFFGSVASTLSVVLFIAGLGIILRGASYALRSGATDGRETLLVDGAFSIASLVTPFALGCAAGAIAAERVPIGNAAGAPFSSWLSPMPLMVGALDGLLLGLHGGDLPRGRRSFAPASRRSPTRSGSERWSPAGSPAPSRSFRAGRRPRRRAFALRRASSTAARWRR